LDGNIDASLYEIMKQKTITCFDKHVPYQGKHELDKMDNKSLYYFHIHAVWALLCGFRENAQAMSDIETFNNR